MIRLIKILNEAQSCFLGKEINAVTSCSSINDLRTFENILDLL